MPSPFAARDAKLSGAMDRAFGEQFTLLPFASSGDVNMPKVADTSRTQYDLTGVWEGPSKSQTPHARGSASDDTAHNWVASVPTVSVADENFTWRPIPNVDRAIRQFDGASYLIVAAPADGMGRTTLYLSARKR